MITGIVVALPEELGTLTRQKIAPGCSAFIAENCLVTLSGAGRENARRAAQNLLNQGAQRLLSWGCAGALDSTLKPGDLCLPETLYDADRQRFVTDASWRKHVQALLEKRFTLCRNAVLAESLYIVASSRGKTALHNNLGAHLVDMESCACASVAKQAGVPFLAIRAIADPVDMELPAAISHAMQENGQIALGDLLFFMLKQPHQIFGLIKLGRHFQQAKKALSMLGNTLDAVTGFASP
ncbi:MAG: phosphorylase family protein [Gammaproteobacteria bacterium]